MVSPLTRLVLFSPRLFVGAFQGIPAHQSHGEFLGLAHARTGEAPYVQRCHLGPIVAYHWRGDNAVTLSTIAPRIEWRGATYEHASGAGFWV